ncbi:MAG: DUF4215 domain-containing protein [Patescibacteria group bacterium]
MTFKSQKTKAVVLLACLMSMSGAFTLKAEKDISSVSWPIVVNLSHMDFGVVSAGQEMEKTFTVSYSGRGDGEYSVIEKYKPKADAVVPSGYDGKISDYCQVNHDDFDRCYKNLCPFIEEQSTEDEGDTVEKAIVSADDTKDIWKVILNTPTVGDIEQDGNGGVVSEGGEYGCDLSFNIASIPGEAVCGNGVKEKNEACDDGNNRNGDGCNAFCRIESCVNNREVCDGRDNNCDGAVDNVFETVKVVGVPTQVFLNDGNTAVTPKVVAKDDGRFAVQEVKDTGYIYMYWNLNTPEDALIGGAKVNVKHREDDGVGVVLEAWDGAKYVQTCDLSESSRNTEEECSLDSIYEGSETENIMLRLKLSGSSAGREFLDWAYLSVDYNKSVPCGVCGNGTVEIGEECDDGNTDSGDGCSNSCTRNRSFIYGCKYNDKNKNGEVDDGEEKMSGFDVQLVSCPFASISDEDIRFFAKSTIGDDKLAGSCSVVATATTGTDGCYAFTNLKSGSYGVNEVEKAGWTQTYPNDDKYYYFNLYSGGSRKNIDFLNHKTAMPVCGNGRVEKGEECDDGNDRNGDGCSCVCRSERDENGEKIASLEIRDEKVNEVTEDTAEFTWTTNKDADSRMVCSTSSLDDDLGEKPDYGYAFSSSTFDTDAKVGKHNVTIYELEAGATYYCRAISSLKNEEVVSSEMTFTTEGKAENAPVSTSLYIYDLTLQGISKNQADLKWNTNREGTTCVVYSAASKSLGDAPSYGYEWTTAGCGDFSKETTDHSVSLTGLKPCTTYYFRLTSSNCTNDAVTVEQKVRTTCSAPSAYYPRTYVPSTSCSVGEKGIAAEGEESAANNADGSNGTADSASTAGTNSATTGAAENFAAATGDNSQGGETVGKVVEKEKYMETKDWLALFLLLAVIFLAANKLINRKNKTGDEEEDELDNEEE